MRTFYEVLPSRKKKKKKFQGAKNQPTNQPPSYIEVRAEK